MKKIISTILALSSFILIGYILINLDTIKSQDPFENQNIIKSKTPLAKQLIADIDNSDEIIIVEYNEKLNDEVFLKSSEIVESTNKLIQFKKILVSEKHELHNIIKNLNSTTPTGVKACIFDPHHTIFFIKNNKIFSKMVICFNCELISYRGISETDINTDFFEKLRIFFEDKKFNTRISSF